MRTGYRRKITKEQYDRAIEHNKKLHEEQPDFIPLMAHPYLCESDLCSVFNEAELYGYGVYCPSVHEEDGEYYVHYDMGSSCD